MPAGGRRRGVAAGLVREAERRAVALGFDVLEFSYISPQHFLLGFYAKLGYGLTGVRFPVTRVVARLGPPPK